jgi:uncharacterized membrane protein YkoI
MNAPSRALLVVCLTVLAAGAAARAATPAPEIPMDQAVKNVERQYHARVVKAETQHNDGGRTTYVLKLLNDAGKVWIVRVDAASGAVQ